MESHGVDKYEWLACDSISFLRFRLFLPCLILVMFHIDVLDCFQNIVTFDVYSQEFLSGFCVFDLGVAEIRSACRLLVTLSTQRGTPRRTVLNALVAAIRYSATIIPSDTGSGTGVGTKGSLLKDTVNDTSHPSTSASAPISVTSPSTGPGSAGTGLSTAGGTLPGLSKTPTKEQGQAQGQVQGQVQGQGAEDSEMCSRRLRTLTRLAAMVTLVIKASGATGIVDPSSTTHTPQVTHTTPYHTKHV
jgi:hypothetical protein